MRKHGLTLTELLVATILIGVVLLGVASFSTAIKHMQDSTSKITILIMRTTAAMTHISKNTSLAIGDKINRGIQLEDDAGTGRWLSVRQDVNTTPEDYNDDIWVIYMKHLITHRLLTCQQDASQGYTPITSPGGPCNLEGNGVTTISQNLVNATFEFIYPQIPDEYEFFVEVTLETKYDPTLTQKDPINNPEYTLNTKISPIAHSW